MDNVLLDAQGSNLKVMDLGEALDCAANPLIKGFRQQYTDMNQQKGGAAYYYAPEIARNVEYGDWLNYKKNDIWAVGIIMYKMLAGNDKDPFATGMGSSQPQSWNALDERYSNATRLLCRDLLRVNFEERVNCSQALGRLLSQNYELSFRRAIAKENFVAAAHLISCIKDVDYARALVQEIITQELVVFRLAYAFKKMNDPDQGRILIKCLLPAYISAMVSGNCSFLMSTKKWPSWY